MRVALTTRTFPLGDLVAAAVDGTAGLGTSSTLATRLAARVVVDLLARTGNARALRALLGPIAGGATSPIQGDGARAAGPTEEHPVVPPRNPTDKHAVVTNDSVRRDGGKSTEDRPVPAAQSEGIAQSAIDHTADEAGS